MNSDLLQGVYKQKRTWSKVCQIVFFTAGDRKICMTLEEGSIAERITLNSQHGIKYSHLQ